MKFIALLVPLKFTCNAKYLLVQFAREDSVDSGNILNAIDIRTTHDTHNLSRSERNLPPTHETTGPWFYFVKTPAQCLLK